jgi:NAD(P)-dependent dehydrogenase (short-subunit alcohol dehydrogenase family)
MNHRFDRPIVVVGASRGLGHGIAIATAKAGARVIAVSRSAAEFPELGNDYGSFQMECVDAADAKVAATLLDRYDPEFVILAAGAAPSMRPLQEHTWETFSVNWQTDVRIAFEWLREALLKPLRPGSRVIVISSGAALSPNGSPLSGGYAGAKATQRLITGYAREEATRAALDITFTTVLPQFAPATDIGRLAVEAYAARAGLSVDDFLLSQPFPLLTPEIAGAAIVELMQADSANIAHAYVLNGAGLRELA